MISNNRILKRLSGVVSDLSKDLNYYPSGSSVLALASSDSLYVGSDLPFNHRWIKVDTANDVSSDVSVQTWNGAEWVETVDVQDETSVGGKSLAQSGIIGFTPDRFTAWGRQNTSEEIPEISTAKIYYLYWARIKFSAGLNPLTAIGFVGHKFSEDADLFSEYPDLNKTLLLSAYKAGKTSWEEQHVAAADDVITDLRAMNVIKGAGQILDAELFRKASIHKTAEIIYRAFSNDYVDQIKLAHDAYKSAMKEKYFNVDRNGDATLTPAERQFAHTGYLSR